jgi:glycosyltransferase involved in cell wall biosynthesis
MNLRTPADSSDSSDPKISLIVCTRNRCVSLEGCLDTIRDLDYDEKAWEFVVVDNGSTDRTADVIRAFAASARFRVKLVFEGTPGLSRARNVGVRHASWPLIAFTDDDCYVAPDFLSQVVDAFSDTDYGYIGGRIILHDPTDAPVTIKEDTAAEEMPPFSVVPAGFIHGANLAFRREVWDAVNGFDPMFGPGAAFVADDVDFVARASAAGFAGAYVPGPTVRHHHGRKPGADIVRMGAIYDRGIAAYLMKCCLDSKMRRSFMRYWYWHILDRWKRGRYVDIAREVFAAAEYLGRRTVS